MPVTIRNLVNEIVGKGFTVQRTQKGHFLVRDSTGRRVAAFAVGHGHNRNLVLDCYVVKIRKELTQGDAL